MFFNTFKLLLSEIKLREKNSNVFKEIAKKSLSILYSKSFLMKKKLLLHI